MKIKSISENALNKFDQLTFIDLSNNFLEKLLEQKLFSGLFNLKVIHLEKNNLKYINGDLFNNSINLEQLYLNNNNLIVLDDDLFRNSNKLKILNVSYNKIDKIHANTFRELINLNQVFLNDNEIASLDEQLFLGIKNLKRIMLHNNNFITERLTLSLEQSVEFFSFKTDQTDNNIDSIDFIKFGNYKKMNLIGQGTFGTVYRVEKDNQTYALKIISYDLKQVSSENIILKTKLKNQYIVEYIEWFLLDANTFCIVTEYCE